MSEISDSVRYTAPDDSYGVTDEQLSKMVKREQRRYMLEWFWNYYKRLDDTAVTYQGADYRADSKPPFTAEDHFINEFSSFIPSKHIQEIIDALRSADPPLWARRDAPPGQKKVDLSVIEARLDAAYHDLSNGRVPRFGSDDESALRALILEQAKSLNSHIGWPPSPSYGSRGHNNPPPDYELEYSLDDAQAALGEIGKELSKTTPSATRVLSASRVLIATGKFVALTLAAKTVDVAAESAWPTMSDYIAVIYEYIVPLIESLTDWIDLVL